MAATTAGLRSPAGGIRGVALALLIVATASSCGEPLDIGALARAAGRAERLTVAVAELIRSDSRLDVVPRSHAFICGTDTPFVAASTSVEMPPDVADPDSADRVTAFLTGEGFTVHRHPSPDDPSGVSLNTNVRDGVGGMLHISDSTVMINFTTRCFPTD